MTRLSKVLGIPKIGYHRGFKCEECLNRGQRPHHAPIRRVKAYPFTDEMPKEMEFELERDG